MAQWRDGDEWLTPAEAAERLGFDLETILLAIDCGVLSPVRFDGDRWLLATTLERFRLDP